MMRFLPPLLLLFPSIVLSNSEDKSLELIKLQKSSNAALVQHVSYFNIEPWGLVDANGLVFIKNKDAYILDTPWTVKDTKKLIKWIKDRGLTPKGAIISHFHTDASNGIDYLNSIGVKTYAGHLTNQLLKAHQRTTATSTITQSTYSLAEGSIEVYYAGPGHSRDNIVVWLPEQKTLFGGCFVKSLASKNLGNIADADLTRWPSSINNILSKYPDIQYVVPGHGAVGDAGLLTHTAHLVKEEQKKSS